jgi:hypothetical protein
VRTAVKIASIGADMRKAIWSVAFLVVILFGVSLQACEDCFEDYDGYHWCEYCDYSPCGYFHAS